jgi:CDP-glucose 4,6-dehydratase
MFISKKFWKKKKVLITGHTGFKGGWLSVLLNILEVNLNGYALNPSGKYNFFNTANIKNIFNSDYRKNITNLNELKKSLKKIKPEIIFHLAAQPSVLESFRNPRKTILTNILGTYNLLEAINYCDSVKCLIIITTDKVYQNYKEKKYFKEDSALGGDDIYSGSKACCEILANSFNKSFYGDKKLRIATVRAGNCFGGGDWTKNRIVKDSLENFFVNKKLILRNPNSNRPWQHVIEPLVGYLKLAEKLCSSQGKEFVGSWNFGPSKKQNMKVIELAQLIKNKMGSNSLIIKNKNLEFIESKYLNINSHKSYKRLNWKPRLSINQSVELTIDWYKAFKLKKNLIKLTTHQIKSYLKKID